jgi:hypothetical protein
MNIAFKITIALIIVFVMRSAVATTSNSDFDAIDFSLYAEFDKSDLPIESNISFPYKNAVVGLRGTADYEQYGRLHLQLGGAYGPFDIVMGEYEMSGYVDIKSLGYGYSYPITFGKSPWSMDFKIDKTLNRYTGHKLGGNKGTKEADPDTLYLDATSDFIRTGLGLNYQVNQDISLTIGAGVGKWDIGAKAGGEALGYNPESTLDESISLMNWPLSTEDSSNLHGKDSYYFVEVALPIMGETAILGYRRSNITTKNQTFINGFYADMTLVNF